MARHVAGKENGGLGWFEVYPVAYEPQYMRRVAGNAFVRMFALVGGLRGIASQAASEPITNKPKESIAVLLGNFHNNDKRYYMASDSCSLGGYGEAHR